MGLQSLFSTIIQKTYKDKTYLGFFCRGNQGDAYFRDGLQNIFITAELYIQNVAKQLNR